MKLKIEKTSNLFKVPSKGKPGDLCYDVWATSEEEIAPNVWRYGLGFKYEMVRTQITINNGVDDKAVYLPYDNISVSIDFRPRSSIWKTGMVLSNSVGTLDEFYRGEAMAVFYHVMPNMPRYKVGDRIGQIKFGFTVPMEFEIVENVNCETERGAGGFGHTGQK